jgi:hypothetical protein
MVYQQANLWIACLCSREMNNLFLAHLRDFCKENVIFSNNTILLSSHTAYMILMHSKVLFKKLLKSTSLYFVSSSVTAQFKL